MRTQTQTRQQAVIPWERLKQVSAQDVADWLGMQQAKGVRERRKYPCPLCGGRKTLHIYPNIGAGWRCFKCQAGTDAVALVQAVRDCHVTEAALDLAAFMGVHIEYEDAPMTRTERIVRRAAPRRIATAAPELPPTDEECERGEEAEGVDPALMLHVAWSMLDLGPIASEYLAERGMCPEVCRAYGLASIESHEEAARLSVLMGHEGWRIARPTLVLPFFGEGKDTMDTLRFRALDGAPVPWRYSSLRGRQPQRPFMHAAITEAARREGTLYLCEGELNAIAVRHLGALAASCSGSSTWREEWAELLRDVPRVVLVVDGDEAGQKWAMSVAASVKARLGIRWFDDHLDAVACPAEMDAADLLARGEEELAETIGVRLPW